MLYMSELPPAHSTLAPHTGGSDRHRRLTADSVPALMCYVDKDLRYLWANQTYWHWFAIPLEKIVGSTVWEVVEPEIHAEIRPWMNQALAGQQAIFELTRNGADGNRRCLYMTYTPDVDARGVVQGFSVLGTDITEHKRFELDAAGVGERLRVAVDAAKLGTWEFDPQSGALKWSNRCKELFGLLPDDPIDFKKNLEGIHPDDRAATIEAVNAALDPSQGGHYDLEFRTVGFRDGVVRWVHASGQAFFKNGKATRFIGTLEDVSERHLAEEERRRLTLELERSNRELSQFAHIAAHDLQSPLRMIRTYTQLLERQLRGQLDEPSKEFIRTILSGGERMDKLISSLLEYARAGECSQEVEPVPMSDIVDEALNNLEVPIKEHNAEIVRGQLPVVTGDAVQLMQVVQNTVSNSLKYRRVDVPLKVQIGAEKHEGMWRFVVEDNGQGIAREYLEQVFQPFKRLHGQDIPGTGMGLAVCRKIVERHAGRMWVESEPGSGTRLCFTLPATVAGGN